MTLSSQVTSATPGLIALRRDLHQHAEIEFQETRTAGIVAERLTAAGLDVEEHIGATGVAAVLQGDGDGPTLMIRADMDALPIAEQTGLPFASTTGAMHACGHDGHTAIAVTAAELLATQRAQLNGRMVFAFQPAEENNTGAQAMADDGFFERYTADRSIALHLGSGEPVGRVSISPGPVLAGKDTFRLTITGRGGHGAMPDLAIDPVVVSAHVIAALQTLVSREIPPNTMGVLTIGEVHSGTAGNIIPDRAVMSGAVRWYDEATQATLIDGLIRTARGVAGGMRAGAEYEWLSGTPPAVNDPDATAWMRTVAAAVAGGDNVVDMEPRTASDDMSLFLREAPGCYFFLGAALPDTGVTRAHHSPTFDIDESALPIGVELFVQAALDYLA
jgi:amidohydrolase